STSRRSRPRRSSGNSGLADPAAVARDADVQTDEPWADSLTAVPDELCGRHARARDHDLLAVRHTLDDLREEHPRLVGVVVGESVRPVHAARSVRSDLTKREKLDKTA